MNIVPSGSNPRIAVITVGYKSRGDLEEYFFALSQSTYTHFDIFFLDNASGDGSAQWIQKMYPKTILCALEKNVGFAEGNNIIIQEALKGSYTYLFLLNPDTLIDAHALINLVAAADEKSILQPLLLLHENGQSTDLVNSAGNTLHYLGFSYVNNYREPAKYFSTNKEIALCSGAVMFVPVVIMRAVGMLESCFFTYHEDVDFSWRVRLYGYEIRLIPSSKVWHKYVFSKSKQKFYYAERNRILFMLKNYELRTLFLTAPFNVITEILMIAFAIKDGWVIQKIAAYGGAVKLLPHILKERKGIQRSRIVSDKNLTSWWSSHLQFGAVSVPGVALFNAICSKYWDVVEGLL